MPPRPVWTRRTEAIGLVLRGRTTRTAGPIAGIVGSVVSLVNQGGIYARYWALQAGASDSPLARSGAAATSRGSTPP